MGAYGLPWSKAHLDRDLAPSPLPADGVKATLFIHQLVGDAYRSGVLGTYVGLNYVDPCFVDQHEMWIYWLIYCRVGAWYTMRTRFSWYRSRIFLSTWGIFSVHPWSSQNIAIWSRKLSLTLVWAWNQEGERANCSVQPKKHWIICHHVMLKERKYMTLYVILW